MASSNRHYLLGVRTYVCFLLAALFAIGTIVLIASGCGSSSPKTISASSTPARTSTAPSRTTPAAQPVIVATGRPLTRSQWLRKGDAICARLNSWLATNSVKSTADFAVVLPQAAIHERAELESLVKLVPPAAHRRDWREFLRATQQWAANSETLGRVAQAEGAAFNVNLPLARATKDLHERLAHVAKREGFKECSLV